jgi:hypothetical protein
VDCGGYRVVVKAYPIWVDEVPEIVSDQRGSLMGERGG